MTLSECALRNEITVQQLRRLCAAGDVKGAEKVNGKWNVPAGAKVPKLTAKGRKAYEKAAAKRTACLDQVANILVTLNL